MANHEQGANKKTSPKRGIRALAAGTALMLAASGCADGRQSGGDVKLKTNPGVEATTTQELPITGTPVIENSTTTTEVETPTTVAAQRITVDGSECGNAAAFEGKIVFNPEDGSWTHYGPEGEVWGTSAEARTQTPAGLDEEAAQAFFCNPGDV